MSEESDPLRLRDDPAAGEAGRVLRGLGLADFTDFDPATSLPDFDPSKHELTTESSDHDVGVEPPAEASAVMQGTTNGMALGKLAKGILLALGVTVPVAVVLSLQTPDDDRPVAPPTAASETSQATTPAATAALDAPPPREEPDLVLADPSDEDAAKEEPDLTERPHKTGKRRSRAELVNSLPPDLAKREIEATNAMRRSLESDPARTLRLAEQGDMEFRGGMFGPERGAYAILALVELGRREEAKRRAKTFLARHPKGALSERVQRALAGN